MPNTRRTFLGTLVAGLSGITGVSFANSVFKFNFGIAERELAGVWQWSGNPDDVSYYVLADDKSVVGYMGGEKLSDRGTWSFEQGRLYIDVIDAPVSFCYQVVDHNRFRQLYWINNGVKEPIQDDPDWNRVDGLPFHTS